MNPQDIAKLRSLTTFDALVDYLRDELDWPIEVEDADDITFDYDPAELGIDPRYAVHIESVKQIRPLADDQPWGIFYVRFESKRLPVVVLRRILHALVPKSRGRDPGRPVWHMSDLLFISAQGEVGYRSVSFAHFRQREGQAAELRTFSWDSRETHFHCIVNLNLEALRWPEDEDDVETWRAQWASAFAVEHRYSITRSQELARELARHAKIVRELVGDVYDVETEAGPLHRLHGSFKEALVHDLTPEGFADMVAQTVAYGLFSARTQSDDLSYDRLVELIPSTNPFLRDLLAELTTEGGVDLEELGVEELVEMLRGTDIDAILHDFGRQTGGGREDPVIHFYELFMTEYDKAQRVKRGEFYTPDPVVSYIVRSVDCLLKTEFGLADGLADTTTWGEMVARTPGWQIPEGVSPDEPFVQILDPATGTGTFSAHVIDVVHETMTAKWQGQGKSLEEMRPAWSEYVTAHLLPRLYGFELMMAPYAITHMKLGLKLRQTGYDFAGNERLRVYLTNTLDEPVEMHETLAFAGFLSKESSAAARVKRQVPVTVVVGNPPYAGHSANESEWIAGLLRGLDGMGRRVESYFEVDGHGLNERNPKWLNDDYVKFIRFGQWQIEQTGVGILAFITNHGYLDGATFCGMRQSMMTAFERIRILDLHGSLIRKERTPDGGPDQNVFDIQPGVAILLAVKKPTQEACSESSCVEHAELWGLRIDKYQQLQETSIEYTRWTRLMPRSPFYLFIRQDVDLAVEYEQGWKITDILPVNNMGVTTGRDTFVADYSPEELRRRVLVLRSSRSSEEIRREYNLKDSSSFSLARARSWARSSHALDAVIPFSYRLFDERYVIYSPSVLARNREEICRHQIDKENLALVTFRAIRELPWLHVATARHAVAKEYISSLDNCFVFPLYLYSDDDDTTLSRRRLFDMSDTSLWPPGKNGRVPNLDPRFVNDLQERVGLSFISDGGGNLVHTFGPEEVFHYAYGVLHSPTYRERYADFLKRDFPQVPITSDVGLYVDLAHLGADLVALHLLEDDYPVASWNREDGFFPLQHPITTFVQGANGTTMGAFSKSTCYQDGRVYLDTSQRACSSYFDGVPEEVWNFHIGGYQVCYKWLCDRRGTKGEPGRTLTPEDVEHYQRIVVALKETIRLMDEIDAVIEEHGGWPIQ